MATKEEIQNAQWDVDMAITILCDTEQDGSRRQIIAAGQKLDAAQAQD